MLTSGMSGQQRYIVIGDHTLGYRISSDGKGNVWVGVLQGSVLRGGRDWKNGPTACFENELRPATALDFDFFRVTLPPDFSA
jgi:hypothetical protein